ncbi:hypothetical protein Tco_0959428 [Tanacetum coccineum]
MNGVISRRDVVIVVASVLIGGGMWNQTPSTLFPDHPSVGCLKVLIPRVIVFMNIWVSCSEELSSMCSGFGPAETHVCFQCSDPVWSSFSWLRVSGPQPEPHELFQGAAALFSLFSFLLN